MTYRLVHALDGAGFDRFAVSYSGGKGYHIELFFDRAVSVEAARKFYATILQHAEIGPDAHGKVEFRPSSTQGVKLPLGINQKTGRYCGFCDTADGLRVWSPEESREYFRRIRKTDHQRVLDFIAEDVEAYDQREAAEMEDAVARHKPLPIYDQSESFTLARASDRYMHGMTAPGQRHNSFLMLARFMNHHGHDQADALELITEWFAWQDRTFYKSDTEFCARDLAECIEFVYANDQTLHAETRDLTVTFAEIDAIIRRCPGKSQKALTYAMLIHSKRLAAENGVFFMTYKQMEQTAGIAERTARRHIDGIAEIGVIDIVRRNQRIPGTKFNKPNFYRMTLAEQDEEGGRGFEIANGTTFADVVRNMYSERQIRALLPRRQSDAILTS
nr:hypothetical protein [Paenibacillus humicus]